MGIMDHQVPMPLPRLHMATPRLSTLTPLRPMRILLTGRGTILATGPMVTMVEGAIMDTGGRGRVRRLIVSLTLLVGLLFILPSLSSAGGGAGHSGVRTGGVGGLRAAVGTGFSRPLGTRAFSHPGFARGFVAPSSGATGLAEGARMPRSQTSGLVSPPLIIERHGDTYERLVETNRPVRGPLILESRGDKFERIR
jgi:hypothetical protein